MNLSQLKKMNRWRDGFNPLRGLTIMQAVSLLEAGERGEYASLQWLYRAVERRNATLRAVKARRVSAVTQLDWNIKTVEADSAISNFKSEMAKQQATVLQSVYERIDNLREAIAFLVLAEFRGYAHLEKQYAADGSIAHLEPIPQWLLFRKGLYGPWQYNPEARTGAPARKIPF